MVRDLLSTTQREYPARTEMTFYMADEVNPLITKIHALEVKLESARKQLMERTHEYYQLIQDGEKTPLPEPNQVPKFEPESTQISSPKDASPIASELDTIPEESEPDSSTSEIQVDRRPVTPSKLRDHTIVAAFSNRNRDRRVRQLAMIPFLTNNGRQRNMVVDPNVMFSICHPDLLKMVEYDETFPIKPCKEYVNWFRHQTLKSK